MQQAHPVKDVGAWHQIYLQGSSRRKLKSNTKLIHVEVKDSACFSLFYTKMFVESLKEEVYDVIAKEVREL